MFSKGLAKAVEKSCGLLIGAKIFDVVIEFFTARADCFLLVDGVDGLVEGFPSVRFVVGGKGRRGSEVDGNFFVFWSLVDVSFGTK